jgi:RNA 3'-terminal phosphate cyclase (ATP)
MKAVGLTGIGKGMSGVQDRVISDGAHGEGGGQILRTALSLSAITGRPLRIERIRARRRNPGLAAQHLTAVRAAAAICGAQLSGTCSVRCIWILPRKHR